MTYNFSNGSVNGNAAGKYYFEILFTSAEKVLQRGAEDVFQTTFGQTCEVFAKPIKDDINTTEIISEQLLDDEYSFRENLKNVTDITWNFGDGNSSTEPYVIHKFSGASSYLVELDAYNEIASCSNNFDVTINLCNPANTPEITLAHTTGPNPLEVTFDITSGSVNGTEYIWNMGDGTEIIKGDETDVNHTYTNNGEYKVCVATKAQNCFVESCDQVSFCLSYDIPQVAYSDCSDLLNFSVNADPAVQVTWYTSEGVKLGEGHTLDRQVLPGSSSNDFLVAQINDGCKITTLQVPFGRLSPPTTNLLAYKMGNDLNLYHTYEGNQTISANWTAKTYNSTNVLIETTTYSSENVVHPINANAASIEVTLALTYIGTNCSTTVVKNVCIPSNNNDCCDGCSASN